VTTGAETAGFMAMKGSGYYSKVTVSAREAIDAATPWVLEAVDRLPLDDDGPPVRVADLGCADGGTSKEPEGHGMDLLDSLITCVKV
jgi:hypothetical protein